VNDQQDAQIRHQIGATGSLTLSNVSGSVRVRGTDAEDVTVIARDSSGDTPQLVVRRSEGALLVEPERNSRGLLGGSFGFGPRSVEFEVEAPRGARVEISTVSADVDAEGLAGEQHYKTVSGDLELAGAAGRLSIVTVSGDARIQADGTIELTGSTTSGDLRVRAPRIEVLRLRTVSGDVMVTGALGVGAEHAVETVSGDLIVEALEGLTVDSRRALDLARREGRTSVVGNGAARLNFRTMSGDVQVSGADDDRVRRTVDSTHDRPTAPPPQAPPVPPTPPAPPAPPRPSTQAQNDPRAATIDAAFGADEDKLFETDTRDDVPTETVAAVPQHDGSLEILRALERGEIDVDEATRLLEVADRG
jgi:hypothetical protein